MLEEHYTELHQYSSYLDSTKKFKPSTIKNYLHDIGNSVKYIYVIYRILTIDSFQ